MSEAKRVEPTRYRLTVDFTACGDLSMADTAALAAALDVLGLKVVAVTDAWLTYRPRWKTGAL